MNTEHKNPALKFSIDEILKSNGDNDKNSPECSRQNFHKDSLPAWIFCTRYSDRPSSGKTEFPKVSQNNPDNLYKSIN